MPSDDEERPAQDLTEQKPPKLSARRKLRAQATKFRVWAIAILAAALAGIITNAVVSGAPKAVVTIGRDLHIVDTTVNVNVNTAGPLIAAQVTQGFAGCDGGDGWVFPASAASAYETSPAHGPVRHGQTWLSDPRAFGAVEASDAQIQMDVSGPSQRAIVLTGIRVRVFRRQPAIKGAVVNVLPEACAPFTFQIGTIDLDTTPPSWVQPGTPAASAENVSTAPITFPYRVDESNPVPFVITITTLHCDCTWDLELLWSVGTTFGHSVIDDHGRPFQTTAAASLPRVTWTNQGRSWQKTSN
jgi:hypothetical protein